MRACRCGDNKLGAGTRHLDRAQCRGIVITQPSVAVERIAHYERDMARIVQKFGGTSVADVERIRNAALRVKAEVDAGNQIVVVVSAMAGATNQLVDWTRQTCRLHDAREYDAVVASGEQVTAGLMALALQGKGV